MLYTRDGGRKYTNHSERSRFLAVVSTIPPLHALFALLLAWTGARISEALALTPNSFQVDECKVTFVTLKRRKFVTREVPISEALMSELDQFFSLRQAQQHPALAKERCWPFSRVTGWKIVKSVMERAAIYGPQACPKGLRHGAAVGMLQSNVPVHLIKRFLGHSRISTTEIYLNVCGPEERELASRFWRTSAENVAPHLWLAIVQQLWSRFLGIILLPKARQPAPQRNGMSPI